MKNIFFALLILFILELVVLIQVGSAIGALTTISLMFVAMVIGAFLVKLRFAQIAKQIREEQRFDPSLIWIPLAGFLFIFPGFISDIIALILLLPPVHKQIGNVYVKKHPHNFTYEERFYSQSTENNSTKGRVIDGSIDKDPSDDNEQQK